MISDICKLALWQTAGNMATISSAYLKNSLQMIELYKWYRCLLYIQMYNSLKFPHSPQNIRQNCMIYMKTHSHKSAQDHAHQVKTLHGCKVGEISHAAEMNGIIQIKKVQCGINLVPYLKG